MADRRYAQIVGWGKALPARSMHNREFEQIADTTDEWIRTRTGIIERRIAGPGETTATLAIQAAGRALAVANLDPGRVDFVLVCTCTPDKLMPATAPIVQQAIGATRAAAVDVNAACAGFVYGLVMASGLIAAGMHRNVLVVGADTLSRWLDWSDRRVSILFGDGAGAVLLQATDQPTGLFASQLRADGAGADLLHIPAGGSLAPSTAETLLAGDHFIKMDGQAVFKFAVKIVVESTREVLDRAKLGVDDVDLFIPHQANVRIIDAAAKTLGLPNEKVYTNLDRYGNTSAASIPIALCEAIEEGRMRPGDNLVMCGFGAGLTWGTAVFQWGVPPSIPATDSWQSAASAVDLTRRRHRAQRIAQRAVEAVAP
ncbi:MAG TPA: beta-ketoacyl-ACP synthase III [Chloroflexota bacterium]|jgi:3-oxoacyl-[acyl-carrier-protein] synthase-3|nr:beta-ketoacyl-ACP synthase III [Chloroflexota bacterium]